MSDEQLCLDFIQSQQARLIETLIDWAETNSGSTNLAGLATMLSKAHGAFAPLARGADDQIECVDLPSFTVIGADGLPKQQAVGQALIIRKRASLKRRVLLCGHLDTVFPADHPFQRCRWLDQERLNGPGVADMKGGILSLLAALEAFERTAAAASLGWDLLLSPDEELGSNSSSTLFSQFAGADFGLIYEPSLPNGAYVGQRKGSGNFSIVVRGVASHAGRAFFDGRNAIAKLSAVITDLHALNSPERESTLNVGLVEGGQALNVVPDLAIARFNIRVPDALAAEQLLAQVDQVLDKHRQADYELLRHGQLTRPAKPMDASQHALFAALSAVQDTLGFPTSIVATGGCCDGNNLKALGVPNIDTLGVRGSGIHSDQELMYRSSLVERASVSALLLVRYARGEFRLA